MGDRILLRAIRAVPTVQPVSGCTSPLFENDHVDEDDVPADAGAHLCSGQGCVALTIERKVAADSPIDLSAANEQKP
jgi:hypothetical protein